MVNFNDKNTNYLNLMAGANTAIKCSKGGLVIIRDGEYSPTTLNKIQRIGQFLSSQVDSAENQTYLKSLKNKLIKGAYKNEVLIAKVKDLTLHRGEGFSPSITVVEKAKPIEVVKLGLIFESDNLLTNTAMEKEAKKLLMHGTPVIVNRNFLVAHRHKVLKFQFPCQCFHQKEGNLSVIIPNVEKNLISFGFNKNEFIQGSLTILPPIYSTTAAHDLDKILLKETPEKKFLRVEETHGHGSPASEAGEGYIAGLPSKEFLDVQRVLKKKGTAFGIVSTCYAGGDNINTIKQTYFPLLVTSSSELPSKSGTFDPSIDGILNYVTNCIHLGELELDETSFFSNKNVHEILSNSIMDNAPQMILPSNEPEAITPLSSEHQSFKRLQKGVEEKVIILEGKGGFISPGGTKNHLLKEVIASDHDVQGIAKGTFLMLKLTDSLVKKGIFIRKLECKNDPSDWFSRNFTQVMIYASNEDSLLIFSKLDLLNRPEYYYCYYDSASPDLIQTTQDIADFNYYKRFGKTLQKKGEEGETLFLEFQKTFFGKASDLPLHQIFSTLVKASLYEHGTEKRKEYFRLFQVQLKENFSSENLRAIHSLAKEMKLPLFANITESRLAPELIQRIWQGKEDSTLSFLKKDTHPEALIHIRDMQNKSPLCWALHTDQMELFDYILEKTKNFKEWDESAFLEACRKGSPKILEQILSVGNGTIQNVDSKILIEGLKNALQSKNQEMVQYVIDNGSSFKENLTHAIFLLVQHDQGDILDRFLKMHCTNAIQDTLADPLVLSILNQDIQAVNILLEHGADPNTPTQKGMMPLVVLSESPPNPSQMEIFELLMNKGGYAFFADLRGNTPLPAAMKNKNVPLMQALIKAGASLNEINEASGKTPFELAICEGTLMQPLLESCSLKQLEKDSKEHPLILALQAQDFQLADQLIDEKGMKCKMDDILHDYLYSLKTQAKINAIQWILQHGSEWASNWSTRLQKTAIEMCTLEIVQAVESLIYVTESTDVPTKSPLELLAFALDGYFYFIDRKKSWFADIIIESDKKPVFEAMYGSEKEREKMVRYYLDQVTDFEKPGIELLSIFSAIGNSEFYQHLLDLMIEQCKTDAYKNFYLALQKGDLSQMNLTKKDIAAAWDYLPPPFIISGLKNPSQALIHNVLNQMQYANIPQMDEAKRIPILLKMVYLCRDDLSMQYTVASYATMKETWQYFKVILGIH